MSAGMLTPTREPLPPGWLTAQPALLIREERNGDWGETPESVAGDAHLVKVLRGTDFASAQTGHCAGAPLRRVRGSSVAKRELEPGDILVELSGGSSDQATGRALLIREALLDHADHPVLFTNFVKRVRVDTSKVSPEFFWRAWSYAYWRGRTKTYEKRTTGIRNFKYRDFVSSEAFLVPPLPEQRAIARVLRTVQEAIEATDRVIEAAKELRRSMMEYLFTYGPVPVDQADRVELQNTETGSAPAHWSLFEFREFATLQRGKDLPASQRRKGSTPVIGSSGVVGHHDQVVSEGPGVLVGRSGSAGNAVWAETGFWPLNTTLWVKDFHGNDARFVYHRLDRFDFAPYVSGVSVPTLNRNLVHPVVIAVPGIEEQQKIAGVLNSAGVLSGALENRRGSLEALLQSLLHNLMTGKIRVTPTEQDMEASE